MKSNYKFLGQYIRQVDIRNISGSEENLLGVSTQKRFIDSIANTVGTNFKKYKVVKKNQFAYVPDTSRRGDKIGIALLLDRNEAIVSQAYTVFEVIDENLLNPEYLMMWFRREEFDRYARFMSHGSVREIFSWEEMCNVKLPVPPIEKQREIVKEYNSVLSRINLNEKIRKQMEEILKSIYNQWFVEFNFIYDKETYKLSGGKMKDSELGEIPENWNIGKIGDYCTVKSGYAFKSNLWREKGIPVVKIGSIQNNTLDINEMAYVSKDSIKMTNNYEARDGDILIAMTGATVGKIALVPRISDKIMVNQRVGKFNLGKEPIKKAPFLFATLLRDYIQNDIISVGGDSAQSNISNDDIENLIIVMPPSELIDEYNKICEPLLKKMILCVEENIIMMHLKTILLQKLATIGGGFSGI